MRAIHNLPPGGFTMVEVMIAAIVLLVGVLGAIAMIDRANATRLPPVPARPRPT